MPRNRAVKGHWKSPSTWIVTGARRGPSEGARSLSEYRFEWPEASRGELSTAVSFETEALSGGGFRATPEKVALLCQLGRARSAAELDTRSAVR